jgi:hypothetical protein
MGGNIEGSTSDERDRIRKWSTAFTLRSILFTGSYMVPFQTNPNIIHYFGALTKKVKYNCYVVKL